MNPTDLKFLESMPYVFAGVVVLLALIRLGLKPKKCVVCRSETKDVYIDENNKNISLCKNHIAERWKEDVISSVHNMVVIEPDFVSYPLAYIYATLDKFQEWGFEEEDQSNISAILDSIEGKVCKECGSRASTAYFKKEDYIFPNFSKISITPTYLCKSCVVKRVEPLIRNWSQDFTEGVSAPTNDRGVYHCQEL